MNPIRKDFALSTAQRADARAAIQLLDGTGISMEEAARRAVQGRRALRRILFSVAVDEFVRSRLVGGARVRTVEWYEHKLQTPALKFGEQYFDDIDRPTFHGWIKGLKVSEPMRASLVRACRAVWNWGMSHEPQLVAIDVTAGLNGTSPTKGGDASILTVGETEAILRDAGEYRSAMAMLLFSGVRPEELAGREKPQLLWKHVLAVEKIIRVPAEIAKTGKPRIIEGLPDTLWRFLKPGDADKPICPARSRQAVMRARTAIGRAWPQDATRHTFATYALASTSDPGKVALWLGHEGNPTMLHRHYRGLATKAEADRYWALQPTDSDSA